MSSSDKMKKRRKDKERRKKSCDNFGVKDNMIKIDENNDGKEAVITSLNRCVKCQKFYEAILVEGVDNVTLTSGKLGVGKIVSSCTHCNQLQEGYPTSVKIRFYGTSKEVIFDLKLKED